jgi:alanine-glyoxylate transaminase/serine-glyoxylate transaminase/serine-pyruvate transaminase
MQFSSWMQSLHLARFLSKWMLGELISVRPLQKKCLGSIPGLAPVAVSPKGWECIDRSDDKAHGWFTNLQIWHKYAQEWGDWHPTPVTISVNNVDALLVALEILITEGIDKRMQRYKTLAMRFRNGMREAGL